MDYLLGLVTGFCSGFSFAVVIVRRQMRGRNVRS